MTSPRAHPMVVLAGRAHERGLLDARQVLQLGILAREVEGLGLSIPAGLLLERTGSIAPERLVSLREPGDEEVWTAPPLDPAGRRTVEGALRARRRMFDAAILEALDRARGELASRGLEFQDLEILQFLGALGPEAIERLRTSSGRAAAEYERELAKIASEPAERAPLRSSRPPRRLWPLAVPTSALAALLLVGFLSTRERGDAREPEVELAIEHPTVPSPERDRPPPAGGRAAGLPASIGTFAPGQGISPAELPGEIPLEANASWTAPGVRAAAGYRDLSLRVSFEGPLPDGAWVAIRLVSGGVRTGEFRAVVEGGRADRSFAPGPGAGREIEIRFQPELQHPDVLGSSSLPAGVLARIPLAGTRAVGDEEIASLARARERLEEAAARARGEKGSLAEWRAFLDSFLADLEAIEAPPARALELLARAHSVAVHRARYARPPREDEVPGTEGGVEACARIFEARARECGG